MIRRRTRTQDRSTNFANRRPVTLKVDGLESRLLLTTSLNYGPIATGPGFTVSPLSEVVSPYGSANPPTSALTPVQVTAAYGFNKVSFGSVVGDGAGQTIAIVDAYDAPTIQADLNKFSAQFGIPSTTVTRVNQTGGATLPSTDSSGGWEMEEALDVEWAHAIAPGAKILLVEANSATDANLLAAVDYGAAHASVVSMSWGGGEFSSETSSSYENHFVHAGVSFVASSGDSGAPASWPGVAQNVLSVGGTALNVSGTTYVGETGWSGSGGGPSTYEAQPTYQNGVVTQQTTKRANPDVAYDASPSTGFAVYDSFGASGTSNWIQVGGTSAGAPQWAALIAIANEGRALNGLSSLNASSPKEVATTLYAGAGTSEFHDVASGTSTGNPNYSAAAGYDYVTGVGSPVADQVIASLVGKPSNPPPPSDHLALSASTTETAGQSFTLTVSALTSTGATDSSYTGTIHFTSTDGKATLPADYTFTAADAGAHTFNVTLVTAGSQSVTATDAATSATTGTISSIAVSPAAASQFILTGLPSTATVGAPVSLTATARDAYGNLATNDSGTAHFTSTDGAATLPADYTFSGSDNGSHTFSVTFGTTGSQTVTVADVSAGFAATSTPATVSLTAPSTLTATGVTTSTISLSWTGTSAASSYLIERSASGATGFTQIGTATGTTYTDTALSAGTTYDYRVRATSASGSTSGYSNTISGTTTAASSGPGATIWSNSYVPNENSYAYGSYEVGVKFKADVAGTVTGVRFYKQTWMGGYAHIGHLWSSNGTLLATAKFTSETSSGWEQVSFSSPVAISANTTYIVSFSTGGGYFGISTNYFNNSGVDSGQLHALSNTTAGGDGVYASSLSRFPTTSGSGMNFWADVVFNANASPSIATSAREATGGSTILGTPATTLAAPTDATGTPVGTGATGRTAVVTIPTYPYRRAVNQSLTLGAARPKGVLALGG